MAAMIVTSLLTVPLALHYLSKPNFGLWSLLTQVVSYFMLIDFGMTASVARLLIERKDQQDDGAYARLVNTSFLVGFIQGLIVAGVGVALAPWLAMLFKIPPESHTTFCRLVQWQSFIVAGTFFIRPFRNLLFAHQRTDVVNYTQAIGFLLAIGALALFLRLGHGVMSILWSNAFLLIFTAFANCWACQYLRLFPKTSIGPRFAWREFHELFSYGRDVFIVQIGSLLIITTQPMIISRTLGLEAVATWSVGSKAFFMLSSLIWQFFDLSTPAFAEMMVRQEAVRLRSRTREIAAFSVGAATILAIIFAVLNTTFVQAWTHGKIQWSPINDLFLGIWMIVLSLVHVNSGFILITKRVGAMRYVYLVEGVAFLLVAGYFTSHWGISAMIAASVLCSILFSGAYGIFRMNEYFGGFFKIDQEWFGAPLKALLLLGPFAAAFWWLTQALPPLFRFLFGGIALSLIGGFILLRYILPVSLRPTILKRIPSGLRRDAERWAWPAKETN